jgi:hypothetical protein
VADHHHLTLFGKQAIGDPHRRVVGQQTPRCRELRERVARVAVGFRGLACAQFAAMPDEARAGLTGSGLHCQFRHLLLSPRRERPHRVLVRAHGIPVVRQIQSHAGLDAHDFTSGRCRRRDW